MAKLLSRAVEHFADAIEFAEAYDVSSNKLSAEQRKISEHHRATLFQRATEAFRRAGKLPVSVADDFTAYAIVERRRAVRATRFANLRREKERLGYR